VTPPLDGGWRLVDSLHGRDFKVDVAFWARLTGEEKWILYLASPMVDEQGAGTSYQLIHALLREGPEWGVDPFAVIVLGVGNLMARAASDIIQPKPASGQFAVPNPKPYRGMTRYGGSSFGGIQVDGVYIYPPWEPAMNPVG